MKRSFDLLARPYRVLEYVTFAHMLERCRYCFLPGLAATRSALLLGDGDGRFAARLAQAAPGAQVLAVDSSAAMLGTLARRCTFAGARVQTVCENLAKQLPPSLKQRRYDLVATHFFFDCLSQAEIQGLVEAIRPLLTPDAQWIVSEFHVPQSALRRPAQLLIRSLYFAFRLITGLKTQQMPDYRQTLRKAGLQPTQTVLLLRGLLVAELWRLPPDTQSN